MFYSGSISPPRSPALKKSKGDRRKPLEKKEMGDTRPGSSTVSSGFKESFLVWPMLTRTNYAEWVMLMQMNYEAMEI
jgi:hypothetical protein